MGTTQITASIIAYIFIAAVAYGFLRARDIRDDYQSELETFMAVLWPLTLAWLLLLEAPHQIGKWLYGRSMTDRFLCICVAVCAAVAMVTFIGAMTDEATPPIKQETGLHLKEGLELQTKFDVDG